MNAAAIPREHAPRAATPKLLTPASVQGGNASLDQLEAQKKAAGPGIFSSDASAFAAVRARAPAVLPPLALSTLSILCLLEAALMAAERRSSETKVGYEDIIALSGLSAGLALLGKKAAERGYRRSLLPQVLPAGMPPFAPEPSFWTEMRASGSVRRPPESICLFISFCITEAAFEAVAPWLIGREINSSKVLGLLGIAVGFAVFSTSPNLGATDARK